jgi:hypothetical protein
MRALQITNLLLAVTAAFYGCAGNRAAAETEFKATSIILSGTLDQVVLAITNAFANGVYHGKGFFAPPYDFVVKGQRRIAVPLTNAWQLCAPEKGGRLPLTLVPWRKSMAAYDEDFSIKAEVVTADSTRVSVTPQGSSVTEDNYDRSPHLALALRSSYHPPIPAETTNVYWRIENQLREIQAGRTNALPPTPDTAPGFYSHFWRDLDVKQRLDSDNWKKMVQAWKALEAVEPSPRKDNASGSIVH